MTVLPRGSGSPSQWGQMGRPPKIWSRGQKLHMALTSDRCQSNGNDHLSNFSTLETTCLHSQTAKEKIEKRSGKEGRETEGLAPLLQIPESTPDNSKIGWIALYSSR